MTKVLKYALCSIIIIGIYIGYIYFSTLYQKGSININSTFQIEESDTFHVSMNKILGYSELSFLQKWVIKQYFVRNSFDSKIKVGTYSLNEGNSIVSLAQVLIHGADKDERILTFIEGWNTQEYKEYFESTDFTEKEQFGEVIANKNNFIDEEWFFRV